MSLNRCPHCGIKLGNFLWADFCPHCQQELKHNTRPLVAGPPKKPASEASWLMRGLRRVVKIIES
jgi:hypothetical protein